MTGAIFRATFAVEDQRYEALITYKQREAYLQYRFSQPDRLFFADRRQHKRYPFRPRESAYVTAADGGIPGLGVAGSLVNIGMGGLCLRVDRVLRMEDGLRIPPSTALFERGRGFPRVRIQDLPRLPMLEVSGWVSHTEERGSEILLGFQFGELYEDQARSLNDSLTFREKMFHSRPGGGIADTGGAARKDVSAKRFETAAAPVIQDAAQDEPPKASLDPERLLRRKTARLVLVGPDEASLARYRQGLWRCGFHRLETAPGCPEALALWQGLGRSAPRLVLLDLAGAEQGDQEPLAAVRRLEKERTALGEVPTAIVCEDIDPTLLLGQAAGTRFLLWGHEDEAWVPLLDELLGLGDE